MHALLEEAYSLWETLSFIWAVSHFDVFVFMFQFVQ